MIKISIAILFGMYRYFFGPLFSFLFNNGRSWCRFTPSCSVYVHAVFQKYPYKKACTLAYLRIKKCHGHGTFPEYDPIP